MPIFADSRQISVTMAKALEQSQKEGQIDHAHLCAYPGNMVKIGPLHSETISL